MYDDLVDQLDLKTLENEDEEYVNILNLLDNKHLQEELVKEEEEEKEEDEFKLELLNDIIREENENKKVDNV